MSNKKRQPACNSPLPPTFSEENYPHLKKDPTKNVELIYKRFLTIKHGDDRTKMTDLDPFIIDDDLKLLLGKKTYYKVTKTRAGHLLIEIDRKDTLKKLMQTKNIGDIPVVITEHDQLNTCKGVIYCDNKEVQKKTDDELLARIQSDNVKAIYRIKKRKEGKVDEYENTDNFVITFDTRTLPQSIKIGYEIVEVKAHIPNPRRCFKCQMYGHGQNQCTHDTRCATCGQEGHEYGSDDCDEQMHCFHCEQEHATTCKKCPMFLLEKGIIQDKIKYGLTFRQARERVYQANPHLVSQIPKLNKTNTKTTYSNVLTHQNIPDSVQQQLQKQEQEIKSLTEQISELVKIITHSRSSVISINESDSEAPHKRHRQNFVHRGRNKRRYVEGSFPQTTSEEDESSLTRKPSKQRAASSRQEVPNMSVIQQLLPNVRAASGRQEANKQPASDLQNMETSPSEGAVGGVLDLTVLTPTHTSSASLDQKVKEGTKGSSSGPPKDQKSDVSIKKQPKPPPYQSAKSKVDSHRK